MDRVIAIYARESGQGMAFPAPVPVVSDDGAPPPELSDEPPPAAKGIQLVTQPGTSSGDGLPPEPPQPAKRKRPALKRIK